MKITNYRLADLAEDWKYYFKTETRGQAILNVGNELLRLPYRHFHFLIIARSLLEPFPRFTPGIPLTIRKFDPSDLARVTEIDRPSETGVFDRRLADGHIGVAAFSNQKLAGYAWGCKNVDPNIERIDLQLEPSDFLSGGAYTAPAYRRSGVQTSLTLEQFRIFRDLGYRRAICYIEASNLPSLKAWNTLGGEVVGVADYFRFGLWRWVRLDYPGQLASKHIVFQEG
jgi:GNAT superfamily N-acetyltransferase